MRVLVTGGKGFIGRKVVGILDSGDGDDVVVLDQEDGGVLNKPYLAKAMAGTDVCLHLGACSGNLLFDDEEHGLSVNILGTRNVLEAARASKVKRVVFVSTQSSYARSPLPHHEDDPLAADINLYTASKVFGEWLCQAYWRRYGLETVVLRFSSVYGPGEESKGLVANPVSLFIQRMLRGERPVLYGDGYQTRDLLYVQDAAKAVVHAASSNVQPGEVYNVSTGRATTFRRVIELINRSLGTSLEPEFAPFPPAGLQTEYVRRQWTDNGKLMATGWVPEVSVEEGIQLTAGHFAILCAKEEGTPLIGRVTEPVGKSGARWVQ